MNRTVATWLSLVTILVLVAIAIGMIGLVLSAKATDEKADDTDVTQQLGELSGNVETDVQDLGGAIEGLSGQVEELSGQVDALAAEEATQVEQVSSLEAEISGLDERVTAIEDLLGDALDDEE